MPSAGLKLSGTKMKTDAIIIRFKMIGAAAGAANFPREFKMPDWKETMEINSRNGKVIRERVVVSSSFPGSSAKPGASSRTTPGIKISITITKRVTKNVRAEIALDAKLRASSLFSLTNLWESIGTNAVVKAPSANRLRNRLGILNAAKKASETAPAPR